MKRILFRHERKIIQAFAEVLIPLSTASHPEEMSRLLDSIEDLFRYTPRDMAYIYRACLWVLELGAFFYYAKFKLMTQMDVALRERYVAAWHNTWWSTKRIVKRYVEATIFANYYSMPDIAKRVCGYDPKFKPPLSTQDFPSENLIRNFPNKNIHEDVDVCVIGTGAGGAVVAKELAQAGHSVVVLEEGGYFTDCDFGADTVTMVKKLFRNAGVTNTFGWPTIYITLGRCVGGATLINSGTCFRAPDAVFEKWASNFGLVNWAPSHMKTHYDEVERAICVAPTEERFQGRSGVFFERGLKKLGHKLMPLMRNVPNCCGSGVCFLGCPTNAKLSTQLSYVPLALEAGARVYTHCRAQKIVHKRRHAVEVEGQFLDLDKKGPLIHVKAKVIVVACGTFHTPVLLKKSHVPNISGQIGHNLTLHPTAKVIAFFDEEVRGWEGIPQGYYSDALAGDGIMLVGTFLPPAFTAGSFLLTGKAHHEAMEQYNHWALFGMLVSDTSRGIVIRGLNGNSIAIYNINRTDLPKYRKGIKFLADTFFEAGAKKILLPIFTLPQITREQGTAPIEKLRLRNKDLDLQAFHPLGTCRMGADPREAVLDPFARVYGLDNLFVVDGSIFPTSLGINPMLTIMAAAHKISEHIHRNFI